MTIYLIRRFAQAIAFIAFATLLTYTFVVLVMPTGPNWHYHNLLIQAQQGTTDPFAPPPGPQIADLERRYKLDKPWPLNFLLWLFDPTLEPQPQPATNVQDQTRGIDIHIGGLHVQGAGILTGDFGRSRGTSRAQYVGDLIGDRVGNTLLLVGPALLISFLVALPIGIIGATRHRSWLDHMLTFVAYAGRSMPPFALGLILVLFLAVVPYQLHTTGHVAWLPYLPVGDVSTLGQESNWSDRIYHLVLPVTTLAITQIAWLSRYVRSSMLEVLHQDYIRTARAKGLSTRRVVWKHALRNALIPLITVFGLALPGMASGAIIVEQVFSYHGLGQLYYRALGGTLVTAGATGLGPDEIPPIGYPLDYPVVLVMTILLVAVVALSNMLADVLYVAADPRTNPSES
jgi:peptide/nickel transport system permease protein